MPIKKLDWAKISLILLQPEEHIESSQFMMFHNFSDCLDKNKNCRKIIQIILIVIFMSIYLVSSMAS